MPACLGIEATLLAARARVLRPVIRERGNDVRGPFDVDRRAHAGQQVTGVDRIVDVVVQVRDAGADPVEVGLVNRRPTAELRRGRGRVELEQAFATVEMLDGVIARREEHGDFRSHLLLDLASTQHVEHERPRFFEITDRGFDLSAAV